MPAIPYPTKQEMQNALRRELHLRKKHPRHRITTGLSSPAQLADTLALEAALAVVSYLDADAIERMQWEAEATRITPELF